MSRATLPGGQALGELLHPLGATTGQIAFTSSGGTAVIVHVTI